VLPVIEHVTDLRLVSVYLRNAWAWERRDWTRECIFSVGAMAWWRERTVDAMESDAGGDAYL
jgi:hypothetical protein